MPIKYSVNRFNHHSFNLGAIVFQFRDYESTWTKIPITPGWVSNNYTDETIPTITYDLNNNASFRLKTKIEPKKTWNSWRFGDRKVYTYDNITPKFKFMIDSYLYAVYQDEIFFRESIKRKRYKIPDWSNNGT